MSLPNGTRLGPYEILAPLGAGGMGEVYRARDSRLGREVAIKILPQAFAADAERLERFQREAKVLSAMNHPNLLVVYDVGFQDGVHFLVSELLQGQTLRESLAHALLPRRKVSDYGLQLANGLAAAHQKEIVHRDLKPENIFITRDERVKILDFGLAKQAKAAAAMNAATMTVSAPTQAGVVMGTAGYMSPEQVRGEAVDHRSDIFSLGTILYEMHSGKQAFHRASGVETMNAILKEEPPELTDLDVSPGWKRIVRRCLEKAPERRFQSASDLGFAIESLSGTSSSKGTPVVAARSRFHNRALWIAGGTVAAAAVLAFVVGAKYAARPVPSYRQLVLGPGYVSYARFTPDGANVVYGASWNGKPLQVFSTRVDGVESRSLGLPSADVLSTSGVGDMAILLGRHNTFQWTTSGTLGRVSLSGGAPRTLIDDVCDADISNDGQQFAIVRCATEQPTLEFPIGNVLYRNNGWMDHPAISPEGKEVAFIDHPIFGDDRGFVSLVDASGKVHRLTPEWSSVKGLVWSRKTDEVWFSASEGGEPSEVRAVTRSGKERVLLSAPIDLYIRDINSKGQVLLLAALSTSEIAMRRPGMKADRVVDFGSSTGAIAGLSKDGSLLAVNVSGAGTGTDYLTCVVHTDAPELIQLGQGAPSSISPDGKWIMSILPSSLGKMILYPTGTGEPRNFNLGTVANLKVFSSWTSDSSRFAFTGSDAGKATRMYLMEVASGKIRPVTPEGTSDGMISPDGRVMIAKNASGFASYPVDGGAEVPVRGMAAHEYPLQWDSTGRKIYVWDRQFPAHVFLVDPKDGSRTQWLETMPPDPAGLLYANLYLTPDGSTYAYRYRRVLMTLYITDGVQ